MSEYEVTQFLAIVFLVCSGAVALIDGAMQLGFTFTTHLKWSLAWYAVRYTAIVAGVVMALDVLFY